MIRLKGVEDMVEVYYNSGQFPATMKLLERKFARPAEIFTSLAEYYEKNGLTAQQTLEVIIVKEECRGFRPGDRLQMIECRASPRSKGATGQ